MEKQFCVADYRCLTGILLASMYDKTRAVTLYALRGSWEE